MMSFGGKEKKEKEQQTTLADLKNATMITTRVLTNWWNCQPLPWKLTSEGTSLQEELDISSRCTNPRELTKNTD